MTVNCQSTVSQLTVNCRSIDSNLRSIDGLKEKKPNQVETEKKRRAYLLCFGYKKIIAAKAKKVYSLFWKQVSRGSIFAGLTATAKIQPAGLPP